MNDNFLLYKNLKNLSFEVLTYVENIPRKLDYIKSGLQKSLTDAIKLVRYYVVNMNDATRIKSKYIKDLIVELSMIDFYLDYLNNYHLLGKNRMQHFAEELNTIKKLAYGVLSSEKKQD